MFKYILLSSFSVAHICMFRDDHLKLNTPSRGSSLEKTNKELEVDNDFWEGKNQCF